MGRGIPSYLSSTICDEFIDVMGQQVLNVIIAEIKLAKYNSISADSTPDVIHSDPLTYVLRYVKGTGTVERFIKLIPIERHTDEYLADCVDCVKQLTEKPIMCRGRHSLNLVGLRIAVIF